MKKLLGILAVILAAILLVYGPDSRSRQASAGSGETTQPTTQITLPETTQPPTTEAPTEAPTEATTEPPPTTDPQVEALRPYRNLGVCRGLDEAHTFVLFFLDDLSSSWSGEEIAAFNGLYFYPAMDFLQTQGEAWGMEVNRDSFTYSSDVNEGMAYPGVVASDFQEGGAATDIPDKTARSLGFADGREMYRHLQDYTGTDQVAMLFFLNKPGRSYTIRDEHRDGQEELEFSVIFESYPGYATSATAATIAHELLHLFGAEDYYDPYGIFPQRKALAESQIPNDIMLVTYYNVKDNTLSQATAFTVGWTDTVPEIMEDPDWNR